LLLAEQGDVAGAREAYEVAIDSGNVSAMLMALTFLTELDP